MDFTQKKEGVCHKAERENKRARAYHQLPKGGKIEPTCTKAKGNGHSLGMMSVYRRRVVGENKGKKEKLHRLDLRYK